MKIFFIPQGITRSLFKETTPLVSSLSKPALSELNQAIIGYLGKQNTKRDKENERVHLAQTLARYFPNTDTALAAFHVLRRSPSNKHKLYIPTAYGIQALKDSIAKQY